MAMLAASFNTGSKYWHLQVAVVHNKESDEVKEVH